MTKGKEQFLRHCEKCHFIGNSGGNAGPSLVGLGSKMDGTMIRESIIEPSRIISEGYMDKVMPGNFASVMTEEELDALIFYITNQ